MVSSDEEAPVFVFDEKSYGIINKRKLSDPSKPQRRNFGEKELIDLENFSSIPSDKRLTMDAEE